MCMGDDSHKQMFDRINFTSEHDQPTDVWEDDISCRMCGCTYFNPCYGGCQWVEEDLCSNCVAMTY